MKYHHILSALAARCWAMHPETLTAMLDIVRHRIESGRLSAEEVEARIGKAQERQIASRRGDVMVLPVQGVIANRAGMVGDISKPRGSSAEQLSADFSAALADESIKAIVLDVNSPGGTVGGVEELAAEIFAARGVKPVIAQVNSFAASAAYWIASAAEEIVVTPSSEVGSIGVYTVHEDVSRMLEAEGVKRTIISAGRYKVEGNPFEPLGEEARAAIQEDVDAYYDMFVRAVSRGRARPLNDVKESFGEGRMVRAGAAVERGMADRVGTMRDTLQRLGVRQDVAPGSAARQGHKMAVMQRELKLLEMK